ncbi:MAG TPA: GntP family permease [Candidatus Competibacter sp.]|nr:GntP family permease [Candidatus Competibacter sp.]HRX61059.1 GntP family permease [Candidatus Competibacter sp.]HUM90907.1 GntP family permease [Candidatus Competibacter sp.]
MSFLIVLGALVLLMYVAYKGHSVVLFAPVAALLAVLLTDPTLVAPMYLGVFMDKMVNFVKLYFPVFMLGAVFGKVIELSGYSKSIVSAVVDAIGHQRAMLSIVVVCAILTYGGVSLFVVVFAVYPFAAELFRQTHIPKRLIPGTIALGAFTFTMDSLPGTPQIQNIIPTAFFKTTTWAAPWLGVVGAIFIFIVGMLYLESCRRRAHAAGEDYGTNLINEPEPFTHEKLPNPILAITPLFLVGILNYVFTELVPTLYGKSYELTMTGIGAKPVPFEIPKVAAIWAVEAALLSGILFVVVTAWGPIQKKFAEGAKSAVAGSLLASMNTASEYGFGGVIASLPGFLVVADALRAIPNPLVNEAITVTTLAGITGSASGGMSIALATMANHFIEVANTAGIPLEVLHRVASMASGGMDTLPHNGAVITLLAVTGLTHKQSYKDIFAITVIKTSAVFVVIAFYYLTGIY